MKKTLLVILVTLTLLVSFPISVLGICDGNVTFNTMTVPTGDSITILDYEDDVIKSDFTTGTETTVNNRPNVDITLLMFEKTGKTATVTLTVKGEIENRGSIDELWDVLSGDDSDLFDLTMDYALYGIDITTDSNYYAITYMNKECNMTSSEGYMTPKSLEATGSTITVTFDLISENEAFESAHAYSLDMKLIAMIGRSYMDITPSMDNPIELRKTIVDDSTGGSSYKYAELGETVRFNISITYHDTDGPGIGERIKNIIVRDDLPEGLEYAYNATLDGVLSDDGRNVTWNLTSTYVALYDGDSYFIEFDTVCTEAGLQKNKVNVTALEKCYSRIRYKEAYAHVNVNSQNETEDSIKPVVNITKPKEKTLYRNDKEIRSLLFRTRIVGPITIEVNASDEGSGLDKIDIYIDDELKTTINVTDNSNIFNWTWNEQFLLPRFHTIKVVAYDKNGNNESDEVKVLKMGFFMNHPKLTLLLAGVTAGLLTAGLLLLNKLGNNDSGDGDGDGSDETMVDPVANPGGPYSGKISEEIEFDGSDSYDPNEDEINYEWDFGDGNTADGKNPVHAYNEPGKYTVTLTVTDGDGNSGVLTTEVVISSSDVEGESDGDEDDIFWYIVSALGAILLLLAGALFLGRKFYV